MKDYDKEVLREDGYTVELSNEGDLKKHNPNFYNPNKETVPCVAEWEHEKTSNTWKQISCKRMTKSPFCVCSNHKSLKNYPLHEKDWLGRVILPGKTREECRTWALPHHYITRLLVGWIGKDANRSEMVDLFIDEIIGKLHTKIPDATTLQKIFEGKSQGMHPDEFVKITKELTDAYFPEDKFGGVLLDGKRIKFKKMILGNVPIRVIASSMVLALGCEESNRGDARGCLLNGLEPRYANIFMPLGLYLLRRKGASESEARISIRG
ncbi:hypothetical protein FJZ53_06965 [Candidatus Woesearchaeota archaeon]|nr:hypothetical protein [Candidatus Woesearchaeota archaeon]